VVFRDCSSPSDAPAGIPLRDRDAASCRDRRAAPGSLPPIRTSAEPKTWRPSSSAACFRCPGRAATSSRCGAKRMLYLSLGGAV